MKLKNIMIAAAIGLVPVAWSSLPASAESDRSVIGEPSNANFEGHTIDLSDGWGDASFCIELGTHTDCYRSEKEFVEASAEVAGIGVSVASSCSTGLRLYRSTLYGGGLLTLTTRNVVLNLSTYGFDNDTSSYVVGSCAATFYSGSNASGSVYSGPTGGGSSAPSMLSAWDNVVSSVLIS